MKEVITNQATHPGTQPTKVRAIEKLLQIYQWEVRPRDDGALTRYGRNGATLIPAMLEEDLVFCEVLEERISSGAVFQFEAVRENLVNFHTQRILLPHPMVTVLRRQS